MLVTPFAQKAGQSCENAPFSLLPDCASTGALQLSGLGVLGWPCSPVHIFISTFRFASCQLSDLDSPRTPQAFAGSLRWFVSGPGKD